MRPFIFFITIFLPLFSFAAHFENLVDLTIKIEDVNLKIKITNLNFNGEEVKLDEPDLFKPRKIARYRLPPGRYMLNWTTEKAGTKFANESPSENHERILVLERGDITINVTIKGNAINLF